jgi:DNA polymerase elongation subunit (family B)
MLEFFLGAWQKLKIDAVTGWSIEGFDIPYLVNRLRKLGLDAEALSPYHRLRDRRVPLRKGKHMMTYDILGVNILDYLNLYKKFAYTSQENYKLHTVAQAELGRGKLDFSEYKNLNNLRNDNYQKYIEYNIGDSELVRDIELKRRLLLLIFNLTYSSKVNMNDCFKQTRMWDSIIYNFLKEEDKIIIPKRKERDDDDAEGEEDKIEGAYVQEIKPSYKEDILTLDFSSLYPHLEMMFNIGPETFVRKETVDIEELIAGTETYLTSLAKASNLALAANGAMFRRDKKSFFSRLMAKFFEERTTYRKLMRQCEEQLERGAENKKELEDLISRYDTIQYVKKVCLNSAYGTVANGGFRFFDRDIAEAITISAKCALRWTKRRINEYLNEIFKTSNKEYVFYCDTDSLFLSLSDYNTNEHINNMIKCLGEKHNDPKKPQDKLNDFHNFGVHLENKIVEFAQELTEYLNAYENKLFAKREKIADKGIWTIKKRYVLNLLDKEGTRYDKPKIAVTGLETVRTTTPEVCRSALKECFRIILQEDQATLQKFIDDFRRKFMQQPPDEISLPTGVSEIDKFIGGDGGWRKGTPIYVRASILYNSFLQEKNLTDKYRFITEGEKVKYCYLLLPNPINENVIAFNDYLIPELGLDNYVDYETQFDRAFLNPLQKILDIVNWTDGTQSTLDEFFV